MNLGRNYKIKFPILLYLQQLFFGSLSEVILSPSSFWYSYQVGFLEKCWQQHILQELESYSYDDSFNYFHSEQYWDSYWTHQLELCWQRDCIQYLESCWLQEDR